MSKLSHINEKGEANMVDVSAKPDQTRTARATGFIQLSAETMKQVNANTLKKGDVLSTARIAGIMGAKQTSNLIPLCHPLQLSKVEVEFIVHEDGIEVKAMSKCIGKTGVEMEALTAVNVALLTIYDMCKAVDKNMVMRSIKLIEKTKE
ncbi:cyclic pyranopterin monophosphate synthase MoaC [Labilibacter marinus]|uniref:cyclic pyranopterin monophosphate synthase MoaC n=1 Tax=Labilibacter marinus TaxID=1477105 RepID=UPI00094FF565|nr:cyclic pyranopterin monophosphate synthase MoaC [Labilibacter marinus]